MTTQSADDDSCRRHDLAWATLDWAVTVGLVLIAAFTGSILMGVLGAAWCLLALRQGRLYLKARRQ